MIFQTPHNFFFFKTCDCGCLQNKSLHKAHSWWYTSWVYVVMSHESYISFKISSGMSIKHQSKEAAQHIRRRVCTRKVVYISYTTAHWKIICARRFTSSKKINDSYLHPCKKKKKKVLWVYLRESRRCRVVTGCVIYSRQLQLYQYITYNSGACLKLRHLDMNFNEQWVTVGFSLLTNFHWRPLTCANSSALCSAAQSVRTVFV